MRAKGAFLALLQIDFHAALWGRLSTGGRLAIGHPSASSDKASPPEPVEMTPMAPVDNRRAGWQPAPLFIVLVLACAAFGASPYRLALPKGFPQPKVPADNPLNAEKVRLGRYLFYDKRMSGSGTRSCATCHRQELAFTDGRGQAVGASGQILPRGAMSMVNVAYGAVLTWNNPNMRALEQLFGSDPQELGVVKPELLRLIRRDPIYRALFPRAFAGEKDPYRLVNVAKALASFERSIISAGSPYDRFHFDGDANAISEAAKRGEVLFFLDYGGPSCFRCHGGFAFSDAVNYVGKPRAPAPFHNTGLYNVAGQFSFPLPNPGIYLHTRNPGDVGKFKAPTLRNIALTAPYMHDGSIATLEEAMDHYAAGGRTIAHGPWAGVGKENAGKDPLVHGFPMTAQNRADLVAFLLSLTDEGVTRDPRFGDPWKERKRDRPGGLSYREFK
jgi:cytochrome c peroxidase